MRLKTGLSLSFLHMLNLILLILITGSSWSCSKEQISKEPNYKELLIKVDSIDIVYFPTLVSPDDLFAVNLHGIISSNGCSGFSYSKAYIINQDLIIEAWKKTEISAEVCPAVMVYLDQSLIFSKKLLPLNFTIKIKQPDGTFLEKTLK